MSRSGLDLRFGRKERPGRRVVFRERRDSPPSSRLGSFSLSLFSLSLTPSTSLSFTLLLSNSLSDLGERERERRMREREKRMREREKRMRERRKREGGRGFPTTTTTSLPQPSSPPSLPPPRPLIEEQKEMRIVGFDPTPLDEIRVFRSKKSEVEVEYSLNRTP